MDVITETAIAFGAALAGAWAGAYLANTFERNLKNDERIKANVAAANRALLVMWQHWFALREFRLTYGSQWGDEKIDAWYTTSVPYPKDTQRFEVDIASLDFLFGTNHAEVLGRLVQGEERFREAISTIQRRSDYFLNRVFPRLDAKNVDYGGNVPGDSVLRGILGSQFLDELKQLYPEMVSRTDESIEYLRTLITDLRKYTIQIYPQLAGVVSDYDLTGSH